MLKNKLMIALVGASLTACAAAYVVGRIHQGSIYERRIAKAEIEAFERANELSAKLVETETKLLDKEQLLQEAAHADLSNSGVCLPATRVRRLNLR